MTCVLLIIFKYRMLCDVKIFSVYFQTDYFVSSQHYALFDKLICHSFISFKYIGAILSWRNLELEQLWQTQFWSRDVDRSNFGRRNFSLLPWNPSYNIIICLTYIPYQKIRTSNLSKKVKAFLVLFATDVKFRSPYTYLHHKVKKYKF